jgi:uncharacterized SAM-binding protein YcdF (DUF218 family)
MARAETNPVSGGTTVEEITRFVFLRDLPCAVDLTIVLGSPSISNIEPAVALYHAGLTPKLLITGHGPSPSSPPEWRIYRDHALAAGVPDADIIVEPEARNTPQNFALSAPIIERNLSWDNLQKIAVCCKPLHTRRAYMTARQYLPRHVKIVMLPPTHPADIQSHSWSNTEVGRTRVLGEMRRIGEYALKGDISLEG